jgi:hypothetical protein
MPSTVSIGGSGRNHPANLRSLVRHDPTNPDRQLASERRQCVDSAVWRRPGKDHEARISAGKSHSAILRKRCLPIPDFVVGMRLQIAFLFSKLPPKEKMLLTEEKLKEMQEEQQKQKK